MAGKRALLITVCAATMTVVIVSWISWFIGGFSFGDSTGSYLLTNSAMAVSFTAFGTLVLAHRPGHRIGRLFVAYGVFYALSVGCLGIRAFHLDPGWDRIIDLIGITIWVPAIVVCLPLIIQLFPGGHPLSRRWRPLVWATLGLIVLCPSLTLLPGGLKGEPIADRSDVLGSTAGRVDEVAFVALLAASLAVLIASIVALSLRIARSRGRERLQMMWLLWAVVVFFVLNFQRLVTNHGPIIFLLTLPLIPAAATVAILRHQLYDIRLIINRSIVYGLLTVGVIAAYLGIVAGLSALAKTELSASPLLATAAVAVAFAPARSAVQERIDRLMYGRRRHPAEAAARVGVRLAAGLDGVLRAVCDALRLPSAAISTDGRVVATYGDAPTTLHTVALEVADGVPADLLVGVRTGETHLSRVDSRALELLAAPVGLALQAVRLSDQLRESRKRIVAAREEERRRLRRDLHDGLGSALTAVTLKVDAAHNLRETDPDRSAQLLLDLRADLTGAIADIRRLVYDLRPPDLDELGLAGALRQRAQQSWRGVTIDIPDDLPTLPAAVEVAAYRIATEAVTNALRHGDAETCWVSLRADQGLQLEVRDNGNGRGAAWAHGVGLQSMHERAGELGGTLTAGPTNRGGRVHALLPLEHA